MAFVPFDLERWQSRWEHRVRFNLAESGVHPLRIAELLALTGTDAADLTAVQLGYSQSDGTDELRHAIAGLYTGAGEENVIVTVGSSEANFIACWTVIGAGDRVAVMEPTYRQTWGLAKNFGGQVASFSLMPERGWDLDPRDVARTITSATKLVVVTNPNNPTGRVLTPAARELILDRTAAAGAWLLSDEVYAGAELADDRPTQSLWGSYDRTIVVAGLSKAYGLPGLRVGWIVAPPEFKHEVYARHDYTVICPPAVSDFLARRVLAARGEILARTRRILHENLATLETWLADLDGTLEWWRPECGAICLARYGSSIAGLDLVERLRSEHSLLLAPGEHFGLPRCLRLGYGNEPQELRDALAVLGPALLSLLQD